MEGSYSVLKVTPSIKFSEIWESESVSSSFPLRMTFTLSPFSGV